MAKAKTRQATSSGKRPQRKADTAERLAALRWLAMRIEQLSIELIVTNPGNFDMVEDALRAEVRLLQSMGHPGMPLGDDQCPGGYILCRDGLCAPMCDGPASDAARSARRRR